MPDPADNLSPFVSVIVPVFNDEDRIARAVEALIHQTYPNDRYEVIVVDNGSTDNSLAGALPEDPRFFAVRLGENLGFAAANNCGAADAATLLVATLNPDAFPEPNWLAALVRAAERFPEADMVVPLTPEKALAELPINPNTFIVIATRGHKYDHDALAAAAKTSAKYVGLLGSRRTTILIYEELARAGLPVERIKEIRSPIGLDIRARTPEEIAVSIMSEILMFRLGGTGGPMTLEEHRIDRIVEKVQAERSVAVAD